MPKLREIISRLLAKQIVKDAPANPEAAALAQTVLSQQETIARLRQAEQQRSVLQRKLKDRVKQAKREARQHKDEAKLANREWKRCQSLCAEQEQLLDHYRPFTPRGGGEGSGEPHDALMSPAGRTRKERQAWKSHWMRLGVLHQHPPRRLMPPPVPKAVLPAQPPAIAIVTPSYHQAAFLERTLRSVLDQHYPNLEYVVMDGGSTDGSAAVIQKHAAKLAYWQSAPDGGQSAAVHAGFQKTSAGIMAWLNSDDLLLPGTLAYVAAYFAGHPEVDCVYGHRILVNDADHEVGRWFLPPHDPNMLLWADYIPQETWFWRRRAYEKAGGVDPGFRFALDWDLLLRMQRSGAVFKRLPAFLGAFRVHEAQKSQAEIHHTGAVEAERLRVRELGGSFTKGELERRSTAFQIRALRTMRLWNLGIRW